MIELTITLSDIFVALWIASGWFAIFTWYQINPESRHKFKELLQWRGVDGLILQIIGFFFLSVVGGFWWVGLIKAEMQDG